MTKIYNITEEAVQYMAGYVGRVLQCQGLNFNKELIYGDGSIFKFNHEIFDLIYAGVIEAINTRPEYKATIE